MQGERIPIACELPADAVPDRLAEWRALRDEHLVQVDDIAGGVRMTFRENAAEAVQALVDAESQCCRFLSFTVTRQPGSVVVDCTGPDGAEIVALTLAGRA